MVNQGAKIRSQSTTRSGRSGKGPSAKILAELGLIVGEDGRCGLLANSGISGRGFCAAKDDSYRLPPDEAVYHVRKGYARPNETDA